MLNSKMSDFLYNRTENNAKSLNKNECMKNKTYQSQKIFDNNAPIILKINVVSQKLLIKMLVCMVKALDTMNHD